MNRLLHAFFPAAISSVLIFHISPADAQVTFGFLPSAGSSVQTAGLSPDGLTHFGWGNLTPFTNVEAWWWSGEPTIPSRGLMYHSVRAASFDASVLVGERGGSGYRWTEETGVTPVGLTYARAISWDSSIVAGGLEHGSPPVLSAAIWTPQSGATIVGTLPGASATMVTSISGNGIVAGWSYFSQQSRYSAFVGSAASGLSALEPLAGDDRAQAYAISQDGTVVAGNSASGGWSTQRAVRWVNGAPQDLGVLPGAGWSYANGMNADGSLIVGMSGSTPFIWTEGAGLISVRELLQSHGINTDGILFDRIYVSADGSRLGGQAAFDSVLRSWKATIPTPSSILLFAALPFLTLRRRR